jgi:bifunctional DNase/RNase
MELRRIIISELVEHQIVVLKEVDGERHFPIVIGIFEATSIDRRVKGIQAPRPLTHDLITRWWTSSAARSRTSSSAT